jgi:hypothetical protein
VKIALALAVALLASCGGSSSRPYSRNDLQLLTAYGAKESCSCLFVLEQPEDFCLALTRQSPAIDTVRVDRSKKSVETAALLFWGARAHFVDAQTGCVLEP